MYTYMYDVYGSIADAIATYGAQKYNGAPTAKGGKSKVTITNT